MKKLLGIIVLGLLLSGNAYAKSKTTTIDQNKLIKANKIYVGMSLTEFKKVNGKFQKESTIYSENWDYQIKLNSNGSLDQSQNLFLFKNNSGKEYATSMTGWPGFQKIAKKIILISIHNKTDIIQNWIDANDIVLKDGGTDIWKEAYIIDSFKEAKQLALFKDIKDKHVAKKSDDNSIISKDSIPNVKNSEWKTTQKIGGNPRGMIFFSDGSCKYTDSRTDCEWTQNASKLKFNFGKAFYTVNLSGEKWNGSAHNNKINRSWKSFGEAVFVEDWIEITYVAKDEKPKSSPDDNKVVPAGSGSGFFVSSEGHIITNHHVIDGCNTTKVNFKGNQVDAQILAVDKTNDIAILKVNIKPNSIFPVSNEDVSLLEDVVVAGYPLGKKVSSAIKTHKGVVTALAGAGDNYSNFQTDASINAGNSGGPIMNQKGNIVGIAVATWVEDGVQGVHFGIKSSTLKTFASSNSLTFTQPNNRELTNKDLGKLITEATVYLECHMTVANIKKMISAANNRKAFFSEFK
tara:strand:+ start:1187 stop:2737 length:1551 start_codon:yes stop_codon:yes gene_type:complete